MRRWQLNLELEPNGDRPLFQQLANAIARDILRGRLKPGDTLPGTRELAETLRVNRNTVVAGYAELAAQGLVLTRVGGGTFVAEPPPRPVAIVRPTRDVPTYELSPRVLPRSARATAPANALNLSYSAPDVRLFPAKQLARAFRRAIAQRGRTSLGHPDPRGHPRLRAELATMLSRTRGLSVTPDNIMVTRGVVHGISLVAQTLLANGDVVAVESFGYPPAWNVLRLAGARLLPVPVDRLGLDVAALEKLSSEQRVRAVLVTPHHQFPTGAVMDSARRARLAALAMERRFAIIEDDYDHELHFDGKPILPIAGGVDGANVIYVGSLANLLAPGLYSGFVVAPPAAFEHLLRVRAAGDGQTDAAVECAIAELFEDGEILRHVRRVRRIYAARRDALAAALERHLGGVLEFQVPEGGMALWARVDDEIDVAAWSSRASSEGVVFSSARPYDFHDRSESFVRLAFSYHDEDELEDAVKRMKRALVRSGKRDALRETAVAP